MALRTRRHDRRDNRLHLADADHRDTPANAGDARWTLLTLVRGCRDRLCLRDRDITVLRGLLSLLPPSAGPQERIVFASNRVLIERCDGIDERTLRRRIAHLQGCGLIARRSSPNGKRYQVRDETETHLRYGIDLSPLFAIRDHLQSLAEQCRQDLLRCKALRAVIRDALFHHGHALPPDLAETAHRALRRVLTVESLHDIVTHLRAVTSTAADRLDHDAARLSVSDSQIDRHIQRSKKENLDSDGLEDGCKEKADHSAVTPMKPDQDDISVADCLELAPNAATFAAERISDWNGVLRLSSQLAPAIGLEAVDVQVASRSMGPLGCGLAILGLVESFGRIRNPRAYLRSLAKRAEGGAVDLVRMFRSLTRPVSVGTGHAFA